MEHTHGDRSNSGSRRWDSRHGRWGGPKLKPPTRLVLGLEGVLPLELTEFQRPSDTRGTSILTACPWGICFKELPSLQTSSPTLPLIFFGGKNLFTQFSTRQGQECRPSGDLRQKEDREAVDRNEVCFCI